MTQDFSAEVAAPVSDCATLLHESSSAEAKERLITYLHQLGVSEPALVETLAEECLHRARRRVAPGSQEELLRRALEEAQRRFDHAVARALNMTGGKDFYPVAGARAALLLGCAAGVCGDHLFHSHEDQSELAARMRAVLPLATPPEANLAMPDQHISFFFSSTPKTRK